VIGLASLVLTSVTVAVGLGLVGLAAYLTARAARSMIREFA
jgi:hypothetical protein